VRKASPKDDFPLPHIDVLVGQRCPEFHIFLYGWFFRIQPDKKWLRRIRRKQLLSLPGDDQSKWAPNCEGLYVIKKAFSGGALKLARMDGEDLARLVNSDSVKRYYV
jgi:hypothetical protein